MRVRLFDKRIDGVYYRAIWDSAAKRRSVASLQTHDRAEAERLGRELLAELLRGSSPAHSGPIPLVTLWNEFSSRCAAFKDNKSRTQADAKRRVDVLRAFFGDERDVRSLTADDQREYAKARRRGGIVLADGAVTPPVRERSVEADLVALHQMLTWATTVRGTSGQSWLQRNPLSGVKRDREKNPLRPVATWERFEKTRSAMVALAAEARSDSERERWIKMELALVLAEATGRRLGSIRALSWEDVDLVSRRIRWRAESDKKGVEWSLPIPEPLADELRDFQRRLSVVGGLVFASASDPGVPMDRHLFDKWLTVAEARANLPKLRGALWHSYRRKWASERKHLSLVDVAAAGGWKDTSTLLTCYMQPDEATLLRVMSEPRKLVSGFAG
jgi:integrase